MKKSFLIWLLSFLCDTYNPMSLCFNHLFNELIHLAILNVSSLVHLRHRTSRYSPASWFCWACRSSPRSWEYIFSLISRNGGPTNFGQVGGRWNTFLSFTRVDLFGGVGIAVLVGLGDEQMVWPKSLMESCAQDGWDIVYLREAWVQAQV